MPHAWYAPLDPDCPKVISFQEGYNDPISQSCGCWDDITESFEKEHRASGCERCAEYGAANIEVQ